MFNLKKLITIFTVLTLLITVPISTFALENNANVNTSVGVGTEVQATSIDNTTIGVEDNTTIQTNETVEASEVNQTEEIEETQILSDNNGAHIRLLQLNKAINTQIDVAQTIIDRLKANNVTVNYEKLDNITNQFKAISVEISEFDYNQTADQMAAQFVALKNESKSLSSQFRDEIKNTKRSILDNIRNQVKTLRNERKLLKDTKIDELKKEYKSNQVQRFLKKYNVDVVKIAQEYKAGNITIEQIKQLAINKYKQLSPQDKRKLKAKLGELKVKTKINLEKKRLEIHKKANLKREDDIKNMKERLNNIKQKFEDNKKRIENLREHNKQRLENNKKRIENLREHNKQRIGDNKDRLKNKLSQEDLNRFMNNDNVKNFIRNHPELLVQLRSGNITLDEVKNRFNEFKNSQNDIEINTSIEMDNNSMNIQGGMQSN